MLTRSDTWSWRWCGSSVLSRSGHSASLLGSDLVVWGGRNYTDLEVMDTGKTTWRKISYGSKSAPVARSYHAV